MAIKFFSNKIQIGDYTLSEGNNGLVFTGTADANFNINSIQGSVRGYKAGGYGGGGVTTGINSINFASTVSNASVGSLTQARSTRSGASSPSHGYTAGGQTPSTPLNTIDRFLFSTTANAVDVGDMTNTSFVNSAGWSGEAHGYGMNSTGLDKYAFASTGNAAATLIPAAPTSGSSGIQSYTHGYLSGTYIGNPIYKFQFNNESTWANIGALTQGRSLATGVSSPTYGYTLGGYIVPAVNTVDKFPFASDNNAVDVGDLPAGSNIGTGWSTETHGYHNVGNTSTDTVYRFSFASDYSISSVGSISATQRGAPTAV